MQFNPNFHPYTGSRTPFYAKNGMVCTSQPLAAQAGLDILRQGGNAVDAAIVTAACLTVVEPASNGIGGDAFALVWTGGQLHGLNSSGPAPGSLSIEALKARGYDEIPQLGVIPVTVPGAPAGWAELSRRFGKLPFADVLRPAIRYAEEGYPLSPTVALLWEAAFQTYSRQTGKPFAAWFETFAPAGRAPKAGETWSSPDHARTLRMIAESNAEAFYRGELADRIEQFVAEHGGFLTKADLAAFRPEWVDPIRATYRGYDVWEIPPNGQGLVALLALNILNRFEMPEQPSADTYHLQIEAMKLAFADGKAYITDSRRMKTRVEDLLSEAYGCERGELITDRAGLPEAGRPSSGGTVYLATADAEGNMVSYIQSNYLGFGSGTVVPGTGISLQNRGYNFSMDPNHANCLAPGKRTYHTIIPGFLTRDGVPVGPFGVMGGFMQPQGHVQVLMNTIDFHLHPNAALDAPRWQWTNDRRVLVEPHFPTHIAQELRRRGHDIELSLATLDFGRGQIIWRDPDTGVLCGGCESRTDGAVAAW